ncbi:glutamate synthase subunit beta [Cellulomonas hominis]|jgi:glutamate synthase (NADPH/NADH) small chain|uniref:glutamate synthase subunit beta n=1 Tax=Cellulomonas hominis TaxID=156981 RepID=UPI001C11C5B1|nr:glutamate synthase subunit beta [Cellulomonas hominis]MBU5424572.1 glutamate synthase subunit beta [Cellulomonas hominis]
MADPRGFLAHRSRELPPNRPVPVRLQDWREVHAHRAGHPEDLERLHRQSSRCMDCGVPFCHHACPLGNLMPEWNDLVWRDQWPDAVERMHATNNFPEITGRVCPALCEASCVLGLNQEAVTIREIELAIAEEGFARDLLVPQVPQWQTGQTVAVVGSGPAGLAAAQQLTRAGHTVAVYERADAPGGLLRYGIPEYKLEKAVVDRRIAQMTAEGTRFRCGVEIGVDLSGDELRDRYDAVLVCVGSTVPRDLPVPGRELAGVLPAMDYLRPANRAAVGLDAPGQVVATGLDVVVVGGGDTGADCLGTALRQGARSVTQLEIMPAPPTARGPEQPWPTWPVLFKVSSAHEEGGEREFAAATTEVVGDADGRVRALRLVEVRAVDGRMEPVPGTEREIPAQLVLLALGFTGPEQGPLLAQLGLEVGPRGTFERRDDFRTKVPGVYVAGDAGRGQSLVVWAVAEGRAAAAAVDSYLSGSTALPAPVTASTVAMRP